MPSRPPTLRGTGIIRSGSYPVLVCGDPPLADRLRGPGPRAQGRAISSERDPVSLGSISGQAHGAAFPACPSDLGRFLLLWGPSPEHRGGAVRLVGTPQKRCRGRLPAHRMWFRLQAKARRLPGPGDVRWLGVPRSRNALGPRIAHSALFSGAGALCQGEARQDSGGTHVTLFSQALGPSLVLTPALCDRLVVGLSWGEYPAARTLALRVPPTLRPGAGLLVLRAYGRLRPGSRFLLPAPDRPVCCRHCSGGGHSPRRPVVPLISKHSLRLQPLPPSSSATFPFLKRRLIWWGLSLCAPHRGPASGSGSGLCSGWLGVRSPLVAPGEPWRWDWPAGFDPLSLRGRCFVVVAGGGIGRSRFWVGSWPPGPMSKAFPPRPAPVPQPSPFFCSRRVTAGCGRALVGSLSRLAARTTSPSVPLALHQPATRLALKLQRRPWCGLHPGDIQRMHQYRVALSRHAQFRFAKAVSWA